MVTMVFVTVSETYDLSTKVGKMSLIGIHTPNKEIIQKTYPGLLMNCKFVRIVKQDVVMACASTLPADPLQIGVTAGDIAPQDMFNPILYKACSNDSFSTLEARLQGLGYQTSENTINGQSLVKSDDFTHLTDDFNCYYALLSNRDGFRTASPQQGLEMRGLTPLVFDRFYTNGENGVMTTDGGTSTPVIEPNVLAGDGSLKITQYTARSFRGMAHAMPKFNCTFVTSCSGTDIGVNKCVDNGMGNGKPRNTQATMPDVPPVYTAAIIMPPCKLNQLYYRMVVRTTLEFSGIRPIQEIASFGQMSTDYAPVVYASDYIQQAQSMSVQAGMVDAMDADVQKIMEGA